jgi:hypothetical protein
MTSRAKLDTGHLSRVVLNRVAAWRENGSVLGQRTGRGGRRLVLAIVIAVAAVLVLSAAGARDGRAASRSASVAAGEPQSIPMGDRKTPPGWIAIDKVSNGCGGGPLIGLQNWIGDTATYGNLNPFEPKFKVNFREACNLHDAAYSGAYVWDSLRGKFKDFRDTTQAQADYDLQRDMNLLCNAQIPARWEDARRQCRDGVGHYMLVRAVGRFSYRDRYTLTGGWANTAPGWPVCDIGASLWNMSQSGRDVTATWQHGTSGGAQGSFKGVLVTGDKITDDQVIGQYTITSRPPAQRRRRRRRPRRPRDGSCSIPGRRR